MAYYNSGQTNDRTITIDTDKLYNDLDLMKDIQARVRDGLPQTRKYIDDAVMAVENYGTRCTNFRKYLNDNYQYDKIVSDMEKMLEDADGSTERWQRYTDDWKNLDQNLAQANANIDPRLGTAPTDPTYNTSNIPNPSWDQSTYTPGDNPWERDYDKWTPGDGYTYTPIDDTGGSDYDGWTPGPGAHFPPWDPLPGTDTTGISTTLSTFSSGYEPGIPGFDPNKITSSSIFSSPNGGLGNGLYGNGLGGGFNPNSIGNGNGNYGLGGSFTGNFNGMNNGLYGGLGNGYGSTFSTMGSGEYGNGYGDYSQYLSSGVLGTLSATMSAAGSNLSASSSNYSGVGAGKSNSKGAGGKLGALGSIMRDKLQRGANKLASNLYPSINGKTAQAIAAGALTAGALGVAGAAIGGGAIIGGKMKYYVFSPEDFEKLDEKVQTAILDNMKLAGMNDERIELFKNATFKIPASELDEHIRKAEKAYEQNVDFAKEFKEMYDFALFDEDDVLDKYLLFVAMIIDGANTTDETNIYNLINPSLEESDVDFIYSGIIMEEYVYEDDLEHEDEEEEEEDVEIPQSANGDVSQAVAWLKEMEAE